MEKGLYCEGKGDGTIKGGWKVHETKPTLRKAEPSEELRLKGE